MAHLQAIDRRLIEDVFEMHTGYVLDFSDRTFSEFFLDEINVDIDAPEYCEGGRSKAKRLRSFLNISDKNLAAKAIKALWEYRETIRRSAGRAESVGLANERMTSLLRKLTTDHPAAPVQAPVVQPSHQGISSSQRDQLKSELLRVSQLPPQPRGFAFEKFLKQCFDAFGLEARDAFRLVGEQIDGSFLLGAETYLLEAKWQNLPIGSADLYSFDGKVQNKARFARGLFISNSGFTEDGLASFGRGKAIICMDGLDLHETLSSKTSLTEVLMKKVRRAVETGMPYVPVRDL